LSNFRKTGVNVNAVGEKFLLLIQLSYFNLKLSMKSDIKKENQDLRQNIYEDLSLK